MALALLFMLDFTGFYVIHEKFPESLKKCCSSKLHKMGKNKFAAPKSKNSFSKRKDFVEKLLSRMKIESKRILEEKKNWNYHSET